MPNRKTPEKQKLKTLSNDILIIVF